MVTSLAGRGRRLPAQPGRRGHGDRPPGGAGHRRGALRLPARASWPGCPPRHARTARRTPTWPRSAASGSLVVGAGQSALESAALLHESGADVRMVLRKQQVAWNGAPLARTGRCCSGCGSRRPGLGSGWSTWFYSRHPELFRHLPESTRIYRARTALGPAGASWLRGRVEGQFPVLTGHSLAGAAERAGRRPAGRHRQRRAAHASWPPTTSSPPPATGRTCSRLAFLDRGAAGRLRTVAGTPAVDRDYQIVRARACTSSARPSRPTFGPVMRFVYGTDHAAPDRGAPAVRRGRPARRPDSAGAQRAVTPQRAGPGPQDEPGGAARTSGQPDPAARRPGLPAPGAPARAGRTRRGPHAPVAARGVAAVGLALAAAGLRRRGWRRAAASGLPGWLLAGYAAAVFAALYVLAACTGCGSACGWPTRRAGSW